MWCILYPVDDVVEATLAYRGASEASDAVFIGTDGGGEAFIIDYSTPVPTFASMAYIGDGPGDSLYRDETLDGFVQRLAES
jgi:hypothetical protein